MFPLCAALLALAAPALARETGPEQLDKALKGRVAGPPESCINLARSPHSTIIDDSTILYRVGAGSVVYVQKFKDGCPGLREGMATVTRTPSTRLCRGDIITLIDPPLPGTFGSCALEDFIPYRRAK
ncbi:MAG: hypothetical protein EOP73_29765 [Variovorax sp.]|nr:MAG: hypothetical protein EOP73_29765 [Variovorax sp.]